MPSPTPDPVTPTAPDSKKAGEAGEALVVTCAALCLWFAVAPLSPRHPPVLAKGVMPGESHAAGPAGNQKWFASSPAAAAARRLPRACPFPPADAAKALHLVMAPPAIGSTMRELELMDILQGCMRCPGHSPGVLAACASATAAGRLVLTPPCAHTHDCTAVLRLWTHYCDSHHVAVDPAGAWPCNCSR